MLKRNDARTLKSSALHLLCRQVVQTVRRGMSQTDAGCTFGASLRAVSTWMRLDREGGLQALTLKRRGVARAAVASLIAREYGIKVSLVTVGRYLRAWGLSPQKPVGATCLRAE